MQKAAGPDSEKDETVSLLQSGGSVNSRHYSETDDVPDATKLKPVRPIAAASTSDSRLQHADDDGKEDEDEIGNGNGNEVDRDSRDFLVSFSRIVDYDMTTVEKSPDSLQYVFRKDYMRSGRHLTTNLQTLMHLLKSNFGTGILALPIALKHAGLLVGSIMLIVVGIISVHCMHLLISSAQSMYVKHKAKHLTYGEVTWLAARSGPAFLKSKANFIKSMTDGIINVMQVGFCTVYLLFVSANIGEFINHFLTNPLPIYVYEAVVALALLPYIFVKNLDILAYFTTAGNVLVLIGLMIILSYCITHLMPVSTLPMVGSLSTLPLAFGIAVFAFESVGVILPVENGMRQPSAMRGFNGVLQTAYSLTICIYFATAFYGFLCFGIEIQDSITLSMPQEGIYLAITPVYAVIIFLSFQLQFYVPATSIVSYWKHVQWVQNNRILARYNDAITRLVLWLIIVVLAAVVPYFDLLVSLIGALGGALLVIIWPSIIQICTYWSDFVGPATTSAIDEDEDEDSPIVADVQKASHVSFSQVFTLEHRKDLSAQHKRLWRVLLVKNVFIILFGLLGLVTGTYCSMRDIVLAIGSGSES